MTDGTEISPSPSYFFLDRELLFIDFKVGTHTKQLKKFQLMKSSYISIFRRRLSFYLFLLDCNIYFYIFFAFGLFVSSNVLSIRILLSLYLLWECFTWFWFDGGLQSIKFKKYVFFYPPQTNLQYKIIHSCSCT